MRWVTYGSPAGDRTGVLRDGIIHALSPGAALLDLVGEGHEVLRAHGERALTDPAETVALDQARLRPPIPRPPSVRDCLCYLDHMRNAQRVLAPDATLDDAWYEIPAFYFASPATLVGAYDDVPRSPGAAWFDIELEIAAVVGPGGRDLTPDEAEDRIIGYTIYGDWSARDLQQLEGRLRIGQAKGKDGATTLGPWLVTPDELAHLRPGGKLTLAVEAAVNGTVFGTGSTGAMDWSFGEVMSYASRGVELQPGDVFGSGTVPTCCLLEHLRVADLPAFPGWLRDGDVVTLRVEGLGETRQTVTGTPRPHPLARRPNPDARPAPPNRAPAKLPYTRGLHQISEKDWAWTLPNGGWGLSNCGLVTGPGAALLVDTLYDLPLTREMLAAMRGITGAYPIRQAVLTHANGDHTYGAQLLGDEVTLIAAAGTAGELHEVPPDLMVMTQVADLGPVLGPYLRSCFGGYDYGGIEIRDPDRTYQGSVTLDVGGREVQVHDLGPAHTAADSVVYLPDTGVLYAGDLLFIGGTPIAWAGPLAHWIEACDTMTGFGAQTVVPGHGPVTGPDGIRRVRDYLSWVIEQADAGHAAGLSFTEAAALLDLGEYADWLDAERIVANLYCRYREIEPATPALDAFTLLALMAQWRHDHPAWRNQ